MKGQFFTFFQSAASLITDFDKKIGYFIQILYWSCQAEEKGFGSSSFWHPGKQRTPFSCYSPTITRSNSNKQEFLLKIVKRENMLKSKAA